MLPYGNECKNIPLCCSFDVSRKDVKAIFFDETEKAEDKRGYGLCLSRTSKHSFRISWHQNSLDVYYFINKPIYTDKAL